MSSLLVRFAFFVFGLVGVLPWNIFINAHEYFMDKFHTSNGTRNETNVYQTMFENYFSITGTVTMFFGVIINVVLTERLTCRVRMFVGHVVLLCGLVLTAALTLIDTSKEQGMFFGATLVLIVVSIFGSALIQGSSSGLAAEQASTCMRLFVLGQAAGGVLVSISNVIALSSGIDIRWSSLFYFCFAAVLVVLSGAVYISAEKHVVSIPNTKGLTCVQSDSGIWTEHLITDSEDDSGRGATNECLVESDASLSQDVHLLPIIWKTSTYGLCLLTVLMVTLTCFPAICSSVQSNSRNVSWQKFFTSVACFLLFNSGDCLGRFACNLFKWPKLGQARLLLFLCLLRFVFIPLFFYCNISPRNHSVSVFTEDYEFILMMLLFALTNGYLFSHACEYLPRVVDKKEEELAGSLIVVYSMLGVCLGPLLSVAITKFY